MKERRMNEKEKEKRGGSNKDMRGMNQVKEKKIKSVTKDVTLLRDETFILSNHVQSNNEDVIGAL
jgi:hypothetical protein